MTFLTILGVTEILCGFRLVLEGKACNEIPESSRLKFLEKSALFVQTTLLYKMQKTTPLGQRIEEIEDLALSGTLLAICKKSRQPSLREVMQFSVLLAYACSAPSRTLLQRLLTCVNFNLYSKDLFCWYKQKSDFYALWQ